jgi:hypothetical protein
MVMVCPLAEVSISLAESVPLIVTASKSFTTKSPLVYPVPAVSTVVVGSTSSPLNSLNLSESPASLNKPAYLVVTPASSE